MTQFEGLKYKLNIISFVCNFVILIFKLLMIYNLFLSRGIIVIFKFKLSKVKIDILNGVVK